jgi:hypothetical protein
VSLRQITPANGAAQITINWDGGGTIMTSGQILDVPPGGPLEAAIGLANLTTLTGVQLADDQAAEADTDNG